MTLYGVYARFLIEAETELDATSEVWERLNMVEGVDEIWVETTYEDDE